MFAWACCDPSQNHELIFYGQSDLLRGKKHDADSGKLRRSLQEQSERTMKSESVSHRGYFRWAYPTGQESHESTISFALARAWTARFRPSRLPR